MREARHAIILEASLEVRAPIVTLPYRGRRGRARLFMQGLTGSLFKPLIAAYVLAIAASLVLAMTVTPALCLILLRGAGLRGVNRP